MSATAARYANPRMPIGHAGATAPVHVDARLDPSAFATTATDEVCEGWIVIEPGRIEVRRRHGRYTTRGWSWFAAPHWQFRVPFAVGPGWMKSDPRFLSRESAIAAARRALA